MRGSSIVLMAMIAALCFVGPAANAATVTIDLQDHGDGTFDLYASASLGDNYGISYFNIDLVGILTATHQSPKATEDGTFITRGFTGGAPDLAGDGALFAYQNTQDLTTVIYGIGQTAGSYATVGSPRNVPWAVPVLISSGTYSLNPASPGFGAEAYVNVFTTDDGSDVDPATVELIITPEPVTLTLLAIGGLGLLVGRRRKA